MLGIRRFFWVIMSSITERRQQYSSTLPSALECFGLVETLVVGNTSIQRFKWNGESPFLLKQYCRVFRKSQIFKIQPRDGFRDCSDSHKMLLNDQVFVDRSHSHELIIKDIGYGDTSYLCGGGLWCYRLSQFVMGGACCEWISDKEPLGFDMLPPVSLPFADTTI